MYLLVPALLLFATPAIAQESPQAPPPPPVTPSAPAASAPAAPPAMVVPAPAAGPVAVPEKTYRTERVALTTSAGTIVVALEVERAPVTSANFLRYVDQKRLDGTGFYRALKFTTADAGLIQGGTRGDPKRLLAPIAHEPTSKTGLTNKDGAISMARGAPGSAQGDFFIIVGDLSSLDARPGGDPGFAVFGRVVDGMDVVRAIQSGATDPNKGEGAMKGQMLVTPVRILMARRVSGR